MKVRSVGADVCNYGDLLSSTNPVTNLNVKSVMNYACGINAPVVGFARRRNMQIYAVYKIIMSAVLILTLGEEMFNSYQVAQVADQDYTLYPSVRHRIYRHSSVCGSSASKIPILSGMQAVLFRYIIPNITPKVPCVVDAVQLIARAIGWLIGLRWGIVWIQVVEFFRSCLWNMFGNCYWMTIVIISPSVYWIIKAILDVSVGNYFLCHS